MKLLTTEHLSLHGIGDCDLDNLLSIFMNEEVGKTYMVPDLSKREDGIDLFNRIKTLSNSEEKFVYGIYLDNDLIGLINEVYKDKDTIELGYVINPLYKNNGYATESLKASINELFKIGFKKVIAGAFENNIASMRVMEKAGMTRTEIIEVVEYRGNTYNCKMYSIEK